MGFAPSHHREQLFCKICNCWGIGNVTCGLGAGWSTSIICRELSAAYNSFAATNAPPALPPLPVQYADFAAWQRRWVYGPLPRIDPVRVIARFAD